MNTEDERLKHDEKLNEIASIPVNWVWKLTTNPPNIKYSELNPETFFGKLKLISVNEKKRKNSEISLSLPIFYYQKAINLAEKSTQNLTGFKNLSGLVANNYIGIIHKNKGDYYKAIDFYFNSLKIREEIGIVNWFFRIIL